MNPNAVGLLFGVASVAIVVGAGDTLAQGRGGGHGPMHYDAAAEVTVKGTVKSVNPGPGQGVHVLLETPEGTRELALGPSWYQTEKKYEIAKGDDLEVVGSGSRVDGRDVLLVREIRKGTQTMTFRDAKGFPMWGGHGRR
jgi:hypothetical protein